MISKLIMLILILLVAGLVYYFKFADTGKEQIDSFEKCVEAGGIVLQSYPEQCSVPGVDKMFINPAQKPEI